MKVPQYDNGAEKQHCSEQMGQSGFDRVNDVGNSAGNSSHELLLTCA